MPTLPDPARYAAGTLTRVPVPAPRALDRATAGRGLALAPLVGAGLGVLSALPLLVTDPDLIARLLSATLVVALAAWLSRGLHWDGLADLADGLGSGAPPHRAREIMKRGDVGPFGLLVVLLTVQVQALGLAQLPAGMPAVAGWVLAMTLGRLALAVAAGPWAKPVGPTGLGSVVVGAVGGRSLAVAGGTAALVGIAVVAADLVSGTAALLWAPAAAIGTAGLVVRMAHRRLGGVTGDVLGATVELATAASVLVMGLA